MPARATGIPPQGALVSRNTGDIAVLQGLYRRILGHHPTRGGGDGHSVCLVVSDACTPVVLVTTRTQME